MTWDKHATPTTNTKLHRRLSKVLDELGFGCVEEQKVGRYYLDCFIEEAWVGLEADGYASHAGKAKQDRDAKRDACILSTAALPILRITEKELKNKVAIEATKQKIMDFIVLWSETAEVRRPLGKWIL